MDKVIIAAAGYKGVASAIDGVPDDCPESLLPLPNGETILSRLCRQFRAFERYIVIGTKESTYSKITEWNARTFKFGCPDLNVRPWTDERIEYVSDFGNIIQVKNNDFMTMQNSICEAIDSIHDLSGRTILAAGDQVYSDGLIEDMVAGPFPRQYSACRERRGNTIFFMDELATMMYRKYAQSHRKRGLRAWYGNRKHEFGDYKKDGTEPTGYYFSRICPLVYVTDMIPYHVEGEFPGDVDSPSLYRELVEKWEMW